MYQDRESIYNKYVDDLYDYARSLNFSHDATLDAIHDVFVYLYIKQPNIEDGKLRSYLFSSLRHRLIDIYRSTKRIVFDHEIDVSSALDFDSLELIISKEEAQKAKDTINELLDTLTPKQREIVYLRFFQTLEYEEIADIMKISAESARKSLYRSVKKMRENSSDNFVLLLLLATSSVLHCVSCF